MKSHAEAPAPAPECYTMLIKPKSEGELDFSSNQAIDFSKVSDGHGYKPAERCMQIIWDLHTRPHL